ncbi:LolA family protein [Halomicrobium salinisoli]|uniref:LolA family protein n=1 Tax=Halomicrobium salinisoli TaxID=2878391 RepID=UPI001CF00884|nr:outer membrane lipoprotein carrier protein LolA [Halomicrobium salinisoli]
MARRYVTTERLVLAVVTLVVASGLAGTAWLVAADGNAPARPAVDADVADRYDSIDGLAATRTTVIERNGTDASETTYAVRLRPDTGERRLDLRSGPRRYDRRVSNGSVRWLYDADEGAAIVIPDGGVPEQAVRGERIERLFARLNATDSGDGARPPVEPLPVVPESGAGGSAPARTDLGVDYAGTEAVDGRTAHVLRITPRPGVDADYEQTLWIDAERFFPLRQRTAWTDDGERTAVTTTYADVRFDPGLTDEAFEPAVPENATVRHLETPETRTFRRVGDLRAATDVAVPEPDVPPSYALTYATATEGRIHGVSLRYANDTSWIGVSKYNYTYRNRDDGERVRVGDRNGTLVRGTTHSLSWQCDSYRYTVRGRGVPASLLVDVGRSVGCPADS